VLNLKEHSIEIARKNIEFSRQGVKRFRECAYRYPEGDSFRSIYSDSASIYEGYQLSFEMILLLEGVELSRPFSKPLEDFIDQNRGRIEHMINNKVS